MIDKIQQVDQNVKFLLKSIKCYLEYDIYTVWIIFQSITHLGKYNITNLIVNNYII